GEEQKSTSWHTAHQALSLTCLSPSPRLRATDLLAWKQACTGATAAVVGGGRTQHSIEVCSEPLLRVALEIRMTSRAVNGLVSEAEDGAASYAEDTKHDHSSDNHQAEDDALSSRDLLTKNVREAIDNGDFNTVRALLDNASEMDKDRVLLGPYGESGAGLHDGTTPLLHAATYSQPDTFKELVQASPHDKIVEMLKEKDALGHTILTAAVSSKSVDTFGVVFDAAKGHLNPDQLCTLIESQDEGGATLFTAAVQSWSNGMFEATLANTLDPLGLTKLVDLLTAKDLSGP
ncbi:unnamed protein product, partial [Ectocarpus sp. 12 AP-2014]